MTVDMFAYGHIFLRKRETLNEKKKNYLSYIY